MQVFLDLFYSAAFIIQVTFKENWFLVQTFVSMQCNPFQVNVPFLYSLKTGGAGPNCLI